MHRESVLLLAKTGYIIRDILLGKFSAKLVETMDLVAAVPNPEDPNLLKSASGRPIRFIKYVTREPLYPLGERYFSMQHWMYRVKQIQRENPSLTLVTRLYEPYLSGKRKHFVQFMLFVARIVNALRLTGLFEELFLFMVSRDSSTQKWLEILKKVRPSVVVSTALTLPDDMYAYSSDLPAIVAARKLNIPCGTIVQSWDNLSSKTYILPTWLDRYWTWSESMSQNLLRANPRIRKTERVRAIGSPHFDYHLDASLIMPREIFMSRRGMDPSLPYLLIGTGMEYLLPGEPAAVIDLATQLKIEMPELQVLLRLHPKDKLTRWPEHLDNLTSIGVMVQNPIPADPMDLGGFSPPRDFFSEQINSIYHAAVVINTASSLTVDAAILDRPVISLGYDKVKDRKFPEGRAAFYNRTEHFGSLVKTGGVWVVHSQEQCIEAIRQYISQPELHARNRQALAEKVGGRLDGSAGVNLANDVVDLLEADTKSILSLSY